MSSEVERYLDEMFDQLAGTGIAGRRALAETEDHLRAAVAAGLAEGLPEWRAEHEAVIRFGPAARIAGQVRRVHHGGPVRAAIAAAWLVGGVGLSWLGVMFLAAFYFPGVLRLVHIPLYTDRSCSLFVSPSCQIELPVTRETMVVGLVLLLAGLSLLAARWAAREFAGLPSAGQPVSAFAASLFVVSGLALYADPVVTTGPVPGLRVIAIAAAVATVIAAAQNLALGRRSRWVTQQD